MIEKPFREPDFTDALLQFREIVHGAATLEALVIQGKPLDDILFQPLSGPNPERRTLMRFYPIPYRNDYIEIVVANIIGFSVRGSCSEIPNN